jgi:hypothetical protein
MTLLIMYFDVIFIINSSGTKGYMNNNHNIYYNKLFSRRKDDSIKDIDMIQIFTYQ